MGVKRFRDFLKLGNYRGAFAEALKANDPLQRTIMIAEIVSKSRREEFTPALLDSFSQVRSPYGRAIAASYVGMAFYSLEQERDAERYFSLALELAGSMPSPMLRGEVLMVIGRNLTLSGRYSDGLEALREAFEAVQSSRALYSEVVSALVKLAKTVEESAEEVNNERALDFYALARDVYLTAGFKLQGREVSDRMKLAEDVLRRGSAAVWELLEKGDIENAVRMARFLSSPDRAVSMLRIAYWLVVHEMEGLAREVFNDGVEMILVGKLPVSDGELEATAYRFLRIGRFEEALVLSGLIKDEKRSSELIGNIAVQLAKRGRVEEATEIAGRIGDILIRDKALRTIKRIEDGMGSRSDSKTEPPEAPISAPSNQSKGGEAYPGGEPRELREKG
ncbi:tetratricopeptide repeat protein [Thermococcus sp.]|uniref:tetratricopeptide repeat protein n=1 Tax=Thermococcus sp. TaxID=35749 RepID=UPI00260A7482|nr:tetratricopeptide repeat protein [Thermococcus sp.]